MKRHLRYIRALPVPLGLALVMSGCAVGPRYATPETPSIVLASPQAAEVMQPLEKGAEARPAPWWTFFEDEGLARWVEAALAHNHDIRRAQANLLAARAIFDERQLDRLPGITSSAGYTRSVRQQPGTGGQPVRTLAESWQAGFDVQWEIDLFGRLDRLGRSAMAHAEASQAELELARLSIAAEVARVWFEAQGLRRQLEVAELETESWRQTVSLAEAGTRAGAGLPEDVENARAHLLRSEAAIAPLQAALQKARYRLDVLAGQRPGEGLAEFASLPARPSALQLPVGDADRLIRHRPDVVRAERLLAASVEDVGAATADLYPRLNLGGFIGFFALRGGDLGSAASRAFELAPGLTWPAWRLGNARARLRGAEAISQGALAGYEQALLRAQEDVENAVTELAEQQRHLALLLKAARHAQAAFEIAGKRYRAGAGPYQAVLENQRALFQTKQQIAQAETASYLHVVALYKALGWGAGKHV